MTYALTAKQRMSAITAMERCKKRLWDGISDDVGDSFICIAIAKSAQDFGSKYGKGYGVKAARKLVTRSIAPYSTYEDWLEANGHPDANDWPEPKIQAQRLRFVNACIAALKDSLK